MPFARVCNMWASMTSIPSNDPRRPRIAVLWRTTSGYLYAELRALHAAGADVLLIYEQADEAEAPFDDAALTSGLEAHGWRGEPDEDWLRRIITEFEPSAVLVSSWHIRSYRRLARSLAGRAVRILCMDNQWRATPKQWLGVATSSLFVRPAYDAAFVAGERQAVFANKLGFPAERVLWGVVCCDYDQFARVAAQRGDGPAPTRFLYAGRLVEVKALDVLAEAYARYRSEVADPWPLLVAGTGPLEGELAGREGVEMLGFVEPRDLPDVMAQAGCLVIPSRFEAWSIVIHEAAAAGLPIVCTTSCGAATRFVWDGYNGVVVTPDDSSALASGLARVSNASDADRARMGQGSSRLAQQITPDRWASYLLERVAQLSRDLRLAS